MSANQGKRRPGTTGSEGAAGLGPERILGRAGGVPDCLVATGEEHAVTHPPLTPSLTMDCQTMRECREGGFGIHRESQEVLVC